MIDKYYLGEDIPLRIEMVNDETDEDVLRTNINWATFDIIINEITVGKFRWPSTSGEYTSAAIDGAEDNEIDIPITTAQIEAATPGPGEIEVHAKVNIDDSAYPVTGRTKASVLEGGELCQ